MGYIHLLELVRMGHISEGRQLSVWFSLAFGRCKGGPEKSHSRTQLWQSSLDATLAIGATVRSFIMVSSVYRYESAPAVFIHRGLFP